MPSLEKTSVVCCITNSDLHWDMTVHERTVIFQITAPHPTKKYKIQTSVLTCGYGPREHVDFRKSGPMSQLFNGPEDIKLSKTL